MLAQDFTLEYYVVYFETANWLKSSKYHKMTTCPGAEVTHADLRGDVAAKHYGCPSTNSLKGLESQVKFPPFDGASTPRREAASGSLCAGRPAALCPRSSCARALLVAIVELELQTNNSAQPLPLSH